MRVIRKKSKPSRLHVALKQLLKARFMDWAASVVKAAYFCLVHVQANDLMPNFRKTRGGYQAHVTKPDHGYLHNNTTY